MCQRDIDRAKKATAVRDRERLRREKSAAEGNYPGDDEDEEAQLQRAIDLSRAEAEYRRGVEQRGGAYEHGGGSGSTRGNPMQRMFRSATSQRERPAVEDYNLAAGGRRGMTQLRIDTGRRRVRMQRKLLVKLGQSFSILQEYLEDRLTVHTLSAQSGRHRSGVSFLSLE